MPLFYCLQLFVLWGVGAMFIRDTVLLLSKICHCHYLCSAHSGNKKPPAFECRRSFVFMRISVNISNISMLNLKRVRLTLSKHRILRSA